MASVQPLQITASARPRDVTEIRRTLAAWLAELPPAGLPTELVTHAVGEAVANAVEHAYNEDEQGSGAGRVDVDATFTIGELVVRVRDYGTWRERAGGLHHGLELMHRFADEVVVQRSTSGSEVQLHWRCR